MDEPPWVDLVRSVARAHVQWARQRWLDRGRAGNIHDAIDEILTPPAPPAPVTDEMATARAGLAADGRWAQLVEALALTDLEVEWLALLAMCEVDPRFTRVLGYLDDAEAPAEPSPAAAALFWGWAPGRRPPPDGALTRWALAGPRVAAWQSTSPWSIEPDIAAYVWGVADWAELGSGSAATRPAPVDECLFPALLAEMARSAAAVASAGATGCEVELIGAPGTGRRTLLTQLASVLGRRPLVIAADEGVRGLRTARLLDAVPVWVVDAPADPVGADATPGALTLVARSEPAAQSPDGVVRLSWPIPTTSRAQRAQLWSAHTAAEAPMPVRDWELTPADIRLAAAAAAAGPAAASSVIRRRLRGASMASMTALDCPYDWDDLVLPGHVADSLHRLGNQVRLTQQVLEDWEFRRLCPSTAGVTALFAGPSGTGKTMAAQVLARSLELDLYRVDLAEVVNKYIGETEKRLAEVFAECERSNVMVLFDEADALFGQRTRVRDAHDRFANIEIDYLLQRLDTFTGLAVLATNRKSDLDPAFLRRLRVIVDFVAPAPAERLRLWRLALPPRTSTGEPLSRDLDHEWLARHLELTGAEIKAIALSAAFDARESGQLIGADHVLDASRRELGKRGRVLRVEQPGRTATAESIEPTPRPDPADAALAAVR